MHAGVGRASRFGGLHLVLGCKDVSRITSWGKQKLLFVEQKLFNDELCILKMKQIEYFMYVICGFSTSHSPMTDTVVTGVKFSIE